MTPRSSSPVSAALFFAFVFAIQDDNTQENTVKQQSCRCGHTRFGGGRKLKLDLCSDSLNHPSCDRSFLLADGSSVYLELQVLTFVVPLKQNTALSSALVEALQGRLVLLHLLHYLWAQIHHRLVVSDGQDQYVARSQAALRHRQVTLQTSEEFLLVLEGLFLAWCSVWHSRVSRCWWRGVSPPEGWPDRTSRDQKVELFTKQNVNYKNCRIQTHWSQVSHDSRGLRGCLGCPLWSPPPSWYCARPRPSPSDGLFLPRPPPCFLFRSKKNWRGGSWTERPERRRSKSERMHSLRIHNDISSELSLFRNTVLPLPPRLPGWNSSSACWCRLWQSGWKGSPSRPAAASPALTGPWPSWGRCWRRTNTTDAQNNRVQSAAVVRWQQHLASEVVSTPSSWRGCSRLPGRWSGWHGELFPVEPCDSWECKCDLCQWLSWNDTVDFTILFGAYLYGALS